MPPVIISTELVHDSTPTTVHSTPRSSIHELEDKSQETTKHADTAIAKGSVSDRLPPKQSQSLPKDDSILPLVNIEDVPVEDDPRQWSQGRKVGHKDIRSAVSVLMAAAARYTRHCSLCSPRPYFRCFHLST